MNRKSKIIVSVVGITIVLLALLGITYAYYLTRIEGNTNTNSISVTTADLKLVYGDGNGLVTANDIMPGTTITKTFTVTNAGESKVENYVVALEQIVNDLRRTEDLNYFLECKLANGNSCGETELIDDKEPEFPSGVTEKAIFLNSIDKDVTHYYTLTVTYINEPNEDQSEDMGSSFSTLVNILDKSQIDVTGLRNPSITLAETIIASYGGTDTITEITDFTTVTTGLYKAEDNYGISYYFRGNVTDNYVKFASYEEGATLGDTTFTNTTPMYWRIVRINGDGSIRLAYDGTEFMENGVARNYSIYTGYFDGADDYGLKYYEDGNDSEAKQTLDLWYENHLENKYHKYISDTIFCNNGNLVYDIEYGDSSWDDVIFPSLVCKYKDDSYTVNDEINGNGFLKYPIATITADEACLAGEGNIENDTDKYYLYGETLYWTMTASASDTHGYIYYLGDGDLMDMYSNYDPIGIRPVINLKADVPFTIDEDGTYVIATN